MLHSLLRPETCIIILSIALRFNRSQVIDSSILFLAANFEIILHDCKVVLSNRHTTKSLGLGKGAMKSFLRACSLHSEELLLKAKITILEVVADDSKIVDDDFIIELPHWNAILVKICSMFEKKPERRNELSIADSREIEPSVHRQEASSFSLNILSSDNRTGVTDDNSSSISDDSVPPLESSDSSTSEDDPPPLVGSSSDDSSDGVIGLQPLVTTGRRAVHSFDYAVDYTSSTRSCTVLNPYTLHLDVPLVFGHSSVLVFDKIVLHFGGHDENSYFGNDFLLSYFPEESKWKYLQTFGDIPPLSASSIALPLQSTNSKCILYIDDTYDKWSFSLLDCANMMWSTVNSESDCGTLSKRHRAVVNILPNVGHTTEDVVGSRSVIIVWGGYCFDTQSNLNDVWVVAVNQNGGEGLIVTDRPETSTASDDHSPTAGGTDNSTRSSRLLFSDEDIAPMPISGIRSTCADMKLSQVTRVISKMMSRKTYSIDCKQPFVSGSPPPPRWGSSSAVLNAPSGQRLVIHGGVGQFDGVLADDMVFCLNCSNIGSMLWERVDITGSGPGLRYGHIMTEASSGNILVTGGCQMRRGQWRFRESNDDSIYCLEYISSDVNLITLRWSRISAHQSFPLRMKHTVVSLRCSPGVDKVMIVSLPFARLNFDTYLCILFS